jgi:Membrane dipeptidase (Peptidase family M19)
VDFPLGGSYPSHVHQDSDGDELLGFVDLHTHPMAHLGFGGQLFYGAPDGVIQDVLGSCGHDHGDIFQGGNQFRQTVLARMEGTNAPPWNHGPDGAPGFGSWPRWHDRSHQHMWVEWIRRAWQGGLRAIVALAVNSHTLAAAGQCDNGPYDDMSVGTNQISATRDFIGRHSDFMELADSSSKLRDIVSRGKLAVILGVELDCLGNFYNPVDTHHSQAPFTPVPLPPQIIAEIDRLFGLGVRYVFPVHLTDNVFGGAAIYDRSFDTASRYTFGAHYQVEAAPSDSLIGYDFDQSWLDTLLTDGLALAVLGFDPDSDMPPPVPTISGHRNSRGLTNPQGEVLINHLMDRGMIIDVDHMSERAVQRVLELAEARRYPLLAGHASLRHSGGSEREHLPQTLKRIYALWGLWGLGSARGLDAFASLMHDVEAIVPQSAYALGTDVSGREQQPRPRHNPAPIPDAATRAADGMVVYRDNAGARADALLRCATGARTWDYAIDGCAHYGLLPDMLEEAMQANLVDGVSLDRLFRSAEALATAWQRCEYRYHGMDAVVVDTAGRLWNGIRQDSGWTGFYFEVAGSTRGLGAVREAAVTQTPTGALTFVVVLPDGTLRMAVRDDTSWTGFDDPQGAELHNLVGPPPVGPVLVRRGGGPIHNNPQPAQGALGDIAHAACAYEPAGRLHLLALTSSGGLYHGFRKDQLWTGFSDVQAVVGGRLAAAQVHSAACAFEPGGRLHVVVLGSTGLLHGFRVDSGWTPFGEVADAFGTDFAGRAPTGAACAYEPGGRLHLVVVTDDGSLWHGYRLDTGWTPFERVDLQAGAARVKQAACSYEPGGRLNVLAVTTDGRLLHGYRLDTGWTGFGEVPTNTPAGHFADAAMAASG